MAIEWPTVIAAALASGGVTGAVAYLAKALIERALDVRFDRLNQEQSALIAEATRRQAFIWDAQYSALKTLLALIYRLRNTLRELVAALRQPSKDYNWERSLIERIEKYRAALSELAFEERAILPPDIFPITHQFTKIVASLASALHIAHENLTGLAESSDHTQLIETLSGVEHDLSGIYEEAAERVQSRLGISAPGSAA